MAGRIENKNYLLALLTAISAFNWIDRVALGVIQDGIKHSLSLSDTELGLMGGIAFALFYSVMGIPIARWADRGNRALIITITTVLWSAMVALCGAAANFIQLLIIRVGIGVGEAGCVPPAISLLADRFDRAERPRAVSVYMQGPQIAMVLGYLASGWINEIFGWRITFIAIGAPGLILALLAALTLHEPRIHSLQTAKRPADTGPAERDLPIADTIRCLWSNRSFRHLLVCFAIWSFFGYGLLQWQPTFFIRSHGLSTGEVGTWFGLIYGIVGGVGVYLGGELATRYAAHNERLQLYGCAAAFIFFAIVTAGSLVVTSRVLAFSLMGLAILGGNICQGPIMATMQTLVAPRMRAFSMAIIFFFANLIGLGFGPLAAGALSDVLQPILGHDSLRYALIILCPGYFWAAAHLWLAGKTVEADVRAVSFLEVPGGLSLLPEVGAPAI